LEHEAEKPWALNVRQTIRDSFLRRIRPIARVYENQRRWEEAMSLYQSALELDETAEDLHRGLMTCQREMGHHSEVLRTYHRCREQLLRSLGVSPDAKTQAIYRGVKQLAVGRPSELRSGFAMLAGT
jgi:two-component SAPR family response regulator